jgi:hypothetical protein
MFKNFPKMSQVCVRVITSTERHQMAKMASLHAEAEFDLEAELTALNVEFTPEQLAAIALYLDLAE